MTIRVLIADDHLVFRSGLRELLQHDADVEIVGDVGSSDKLLDVLGRVRVDVLLLDLSMPGGLSGPRLARTVRERHPGIRIVVLTMHEDPDYLHDMFRVGVHGYVVKRSGVDDVLRAVHAAFRGEFHIDASLGGFTVSSLIGPASSVKTHKAGRLTRRESEVCLLLAFGYTNAEVGEKLFISERTVETHRTSIMTKLTLKNRADLVRFAIDHGLLD